MSQLIVLAAGFTDIRPGLIFWTLVTFTVVALVLRAKAWKPILELVDERERQINNAIESAKKERAEAERLLTEQKLAIANERRESAEAMRKAQGEMERFREELMNKSRKEAEELKLEAQRTIQDERARAVAEVRSMAVGLAMEITEKLLGEKLDATKDRALAEKMIAELPQKPVGQPRV